MEFSPKKTKSDSGLSSMSGFSSLEKSPNSPSQKPRFPSSQIAHSNLLPKPYSQQSFPISYHNSADSYNRDGNISKQDYVFSEENLNYIRELSKNVPICSVFENKSIFNMDHSKMAHSQQMPSISHNKMSYYAVPQPTFDEAKHRDYPDLVIGNTFDETKDPKYFPYARSASNVSLQMTEQKAKSTGSFNNLRNIQQATGSMSNLCGTGPQNRANESLHSMQKQTHKHLTDRLVFYPSSNNISDYNSSMNLDYMGYNQDALMPRQQYYMRQSSPNSRHKIQHGNMPKGYIPSMDEARTSRESLANPTMQSQKIYYAEGPSEKSDRYTTNQSGLATVSDNFQNQQQIRSAQRLMQHQQHQQHHVPITYCLDQQHGKSEKKDSSSMTNHKYLNKFSQWLPELKLKKMSKRYRSHSLPAVGDSDDDSLQQSNAILSYPHDKRIQDDRPQQGSSSGKSKIFSTASFRSGQSFLQRKSLSTTVSPPNENGSKKKKRTIASTMSNIMQKAKVYRRHSFTHSSLNNNSQSDRPDGPQNHQKLQIDMPSTSRFIISKSSHQSQIHSDPELIYSDFLSDSEDKSEIFERYPDRDTSNAESLFPTMNQSASHPKSEKASIGLDQGRGMSFYVFNLHLYFRYLKIIIDSSSFNILPKLLKRVMIIIKNAVEIKKKIFNDYFFSHCTLFNL